MEKNTPHNKLSIVRNMLKTGKVRTTITALSEAAGLGLDFAGMLFVINALTIKDFHKSMTTNHSHKIWQDVYKPLTSVGPVYLKLTVSDDVLIVSFKEL